MKIQIKWLLTGKTSTIEELDELLNPRTTILEVKGLIQLRFGFLPREVVLTNRHLLENYMTLEEAGCVGKEDDPVLGAHVVRRLEEDEEGDCNSVGNDGLEEFSHEDFIVGMRMLGKDVPVSVVRLQEVRERPPRARPTFLDASPLPSSAAGGAGDIPPPPPGMPGAGAVQRYDPSITEVYRIFKDVRHGVRRDGCDVDFAIHYPGIQEAFPYWDARLPDSYRYPAIPCGVGEVCLVLFYLGEFSVIEDTEKFCALLRQSLVEKCGINVSTPLPMHEAGCIYPLMGCPIVLTETDAMTLGEALFEDFGKKPSTLQTRSSRDVDVAGGGGLCRPQ
ncbi:hypothetical protein DQ04_00511110 [Trypanosoma grayi]|uniref:hypothetical protein n=1 Tax=Trypanosoma grayi TaxID=71804 RepID=UPI0004F4B480|nr:hypothetical protein DQ04_00511110 [Trypanosoma grayi]KEG14348.1 hypothetical protein DQ04_00511110 [Trypanosoma grayi]